MRTFGVEIEFMGDRTAAIHALRAAGLTCDHGGYIGHSETGWQMKTDGSVMGGGELVSPPLDFDDPTQRGQVDIAVKALQDAGCQPHPSAGIHVHIGCQDLTARQVAAVARCFTKFEDVIYRLATSGWEKFRPGGWQYAMPLKDNIVQGMTKVRSQADLEKVWYGSPDPSGYNTRNHGHGSRYNGLNLHSWFYRKTIEFRIFNSSVNPKRVQCYIAICMAIVEDARRGKSRSVNKAYRLGDMAAGRANPDNALHRFLQVLRYDAGLGEQDMKLVRYCWKDSNAQVDERSPAYR